MKGKDRDPQLSEISKKLDVLIRLSAVSVVKGLKLKQQVEILSDAGFEPGSIADIIGEKGSTVRTALHRLRKERAAAEPQEEGKDEEATGEAAQEEEAPEGKTDDQV